MNPKVTLIPQSSKTNDDAIALVEGLLERLKAGEAISVAIVEVLKGRTVTTAWADSPDGNYHLLNSGAARLAHRLAAE